MCFRLKNDNCKVIFETINIGITTTTAPETTTTSVSTTTKLTNAEETTTTQTSNVNCKDQTKYV